MEMEKSIYKNLQTGKCWKIESMCDELVMVKRGARLETLDRRDFDRLFEPVV